MTLLAVARAIGWVRVTLPTAALGPVGFVAGAVCATSGGAGFLIAPALLAAGLKGEAFVATAATGAVAMHVGRLIGYSTGELLTGTLLAQSLLIALAITAGNAAGRSLRAVLDGRLDGRLEPAALVVCLSMVLVTSV